MAPWPCGTGSKISRSGKARDTYLTCWVTRFRGCFFQVRQIFRCLTAELTPAVPLFHAGALYTFIGLNIFQNMPSIFGIGGKFPSGEFMTECLENMEASGASLAPFILETMVNDERALKQLAKLNIVIYGGGESPLMSLLVLCF